MKNMRILFLHGLESQVGCEKVQYLEKLGHSVQNPGIDYRDKNSYEKLYNTIKHDKYDVIIGSSMGGWFAWHLGKELSTPVLLLNPALHSRMIEPLMEISNFYRIGSWVEEERERSSVFLALGRLDDVIDPKETLEWISDHDNNSLSCMTIMVDDYGHRTDVKNFQKIFNRFKLDIIETNELQPKLV